VTSRRGIACAAAAALLLLTAISVAGQDAKQMAITFDDLPFGYARSLSIDQRRDAVARVLATLRKYNIRAAMFVVGGSLTDENRDLVDAVAAVGHTVGNHSFSHRDFGTMSVEDYAIDIQKGGDAIKPWLKDMHFFRYPLLRQGDTVEKRDAILSWLSLRGIRVAPVTIDNDDFVYNQRLVDAKAEGRDIDVRGEYLDHMLKMSAFYEKKALSVLGRPIKHVLLLHMNYLNALYLDDLLQRFRDDGWSFIPFEDALTDEVYGLKYDHVGVRGAGHLDAIRPQLR
jgi:peptidoglycan/xylan/chitin deacetylase (PgdA/CDA1 family)